MAIKIRDLQSGKVLSVDQDEITLGRQGGKADVGVPNRGVSGMHARLFRKNNDWFIEDLNSSNGTLVDGRRINERVRLNIKSRFVLHNHSFEVQHIEVDAGAETTVYDSGVSKPDERVEPSGHAEKSNEKDKNKEREPTGDAPTTDLPLDDGKENLSTFLRLSIADAFDFYIAAIPALLTGPIRFVDDGVENYRVSALSSRGIFSYMVPTQVFVVLFSVLSTGLGALLAGAFSLQTLVSPLITFAISIVVIALLAPIYHPLTAFVVRILKGQSTYASRSNFLATSLTVVPLSAFFAALATLLQIVPVPFLPLLGHLGMLFATLVSVYIASAWLRHFNVLKAVHILVTILGLLGAVASALAQVRTLMSTTTTVQASDTTAGQVIEIPPVANTAALPTGTKSTPQAETAKNPESPPTGESPEDTPPANPTQGPSTEKSNGSGKAEATPSASEEVSSAPPRQSNYSTFLKRREHIESRIDKDPTLLKKSGILTLYRELHRTSSAIKKKFKRAQKRDGESRVQEKLLQAEVYEATVRIVDTLFAKLQEIDNQAR